MSMPPMNPTRFDPPTSAARAPTRNDPCSSRNLSAARLGEAHVGSKMSHGPFGAEVGAIVERLVAAAADVEDDPDVDRVARLGRGCPVWADKQQRDVRHEEHAEEGEKPFHLADKIRWRTGAGKPGQPERRSG